MIVSAAYKGHYDSIPGKVTPLSNNDILRRLRYILQLDDEKMIEIFALVQKDVSLDQIQAWLKSDDHREFVDCDDLSMACFLNGLIIDMRGPKDGPQPEPETELTNNIVLRKLKIAFELRNEDIMTILERANVSVTKYEVTAYFRRPDHRNFRKCQDKTLRYFLTELQKMANEEDSNS